MYQRTASASSLVLCCGTEPKCMLHEAEVEMVAGLGNSTLVCQGQGVKPEAVGCARCSVTAIVVDMQSAATATLHHITVHR